MELTDTHCHIQSIGLDYGERVTRELWAKTEGLTVDSVVKAARLDGVNRLICVGCDLKDSLLAVNTAQNYDGCWASIGIHPHEAKEYVGNEAKLNEFTDLASKTKVVAVGECGLDYYYDHSPRKDQITILKFQIELALKHNLPLIFHVREAFDDFWPIFDSYSGIRGVLHSYTDTPDNLEKALARGLNIGVNGIATFAKEPALIEVYKKIPFDKLLLETDSPFLSPVPHRGSINQPKNVLAVAKFLADLRQEPLAELASNTTQNAVELFGLEVQQ